MNEPIKNALNEKGYKEFYREVSYKYPEANLILKSMYGRYRIKKTLELLSPYARQNKLLLDAGCGGGIISTSYAMMGGWIVGVDIGSGFIEKSKSKSKKLGLNNKAKFLVGDITNLSFLRDNTFDVVLCSEVLEHLLKPYKALREFKRVLKTGGILILTTPNPLKMSKDIRRTLRCAVSILLKRVVIDKLDIIETSPVVESYGVPSTRYKHTEFAPFELERMLPEFKIIKSVTIVYPFVSKITKNESIRSKFYQYIETIPILNMFGMYSLLVAKKI